MPLHKKQLPLVGDFLNVDVEVTSPKPFKSLPQALVKSAAILFNGKAKRDHLLVFESLDSFSKRARLEQTLRALCSMIENLSPPARREWNSAQSRVFDIGFDAAPKTKASHLAARVHVSLDLVQGVAALNANLTFTAYHQ